MLKKIIQAVIFGLFSAGLILAGNYYARSVDSAGVASYNNAVSIASPAVVNVYNQRAGASNRADGVQQLGSGVIMSENGYILTNQHVVNNAEQIMVALQSGHIMQARLVGADKLTDLAVLKIQGEGLPTIPQNPKRTTKIGDVVLAIGNPLNLGQSITQGIVSATGRNLLSESGRQNFIQTDASINQGNSGGALINSKGELVGINTQSVGRNPNGNELAEGLNFAIPINLANQIMAKIIKDGRVIRGYFGVSSHLLYNNAQGVLISGVSEGGPADLAGIKENDLVLKIGDVEAISPPQMMEVLANISPGTKVKVLILRDNQPQEMEVVVGEYPAY